MSYGSFTTICSSLLLAILLVLSVKVGDAQVMQSGNYQIQSDSVNMGGGLSSSSNYSLESTAGEIASGDSDSATYQLRAGYQQMQEVYIAVSGATTTILSPAIGGISGGVSNGSTTVTVTTDSPSGYALSVQAAMSPAMQSGLNTLADYVPAGANPDYNFTTNAADAHFGYSPEGVDVVQRFLDNGAVCNSGSGNTSFSCWDGLSTSSEIIAQSTEANHPLGTPTTIRFRVGVGGGAQPAPGLYIATTTVTAVPL